MPKSREAEDVHVAVEEEVTRRAGKSAGGNLQLAKSRNDQVATAIRMRLRSEALQIMDLLINLLSELEKTIRKHYKTLFFGRTHLQPAEPITYGHYLMAFHDAILRDLKRLEEFYSRLNLSPMGGCALAGTSISIDRGMVARLLGFEGLVENSLDAVGSRDFALEFLADMTQLALDISRLAEDLVFLTTPEVGQLQLPEDLSFTSSIMPQKKNPDVIELIRAKCAVPIGAFSHTATILHSLPTSYNLDLQEVTPNIWISSRAMQEVTTILRNLVSRTKVRDVDVNRADLAMTTATELANMLVTELGVPFRLAHQVVASAASEFSRSESKQANSWPELVLQKARTMIGNRSEKLKPGLLRAGTVANVVTHKRSLGCPAPRETLRLLRLRAVALGQIVSRQRARRNRVTFAKARLRREVLRLSR
jgi:argininosuccinate lyase